MAPSNALHHAKGCPEWSCTLDQLANVGNSIQSILNGSTARVMLRQELFGPLANTLDILGKWKLALPEHIPKCFPADFVARLLLENPQYVSCPYSPDAAECKDYRLHTCASAKPSGPAHLYTSQLQEFLQIYAPHVACPGRMAILTEFDTAEAMFKAMQSRYCPF